MVKKFDGKVRVVYKNFVVHPDTVTDAHLAGCAAEMQGKFLQFTDMFWKDGFTAYSQSRDPSKLGKDNIMTMVGKLGLDKKKFAADMAGEACGKRLADDANEFRKFGVSATPSFFVNGKFAMFSDPQSMEAIVAAEIAEVEKSGVPADKYYAEVVMAKGLKKFRSKLDAEKEAEKK